MIVVRVFIALLFAALGVALALANPGSTTINYLFGQDQVPTVWVITGSLAIGALIGAAAIGTNTLRWRYQTRRWQHRAELAERRLADRRDADHERS